MGPFLSFALSCTLVYGMGFRMGQLLMCEEEEEEESVGMEIANIQGNRQVCIPSGSNGFVGNKKTNVRVVGLVSPTRRYGYERQDSESGRDKWEEGK